MGYQLRRDLREVLGPDITGLQRAVALEIADDANDASRESWAPLADLARWTGAKDVTVVRNALKRLAASGWEFRVPIGKGKDGRVLYAVPGVRMTFKVPLFTTPEGVATATPSPMKGEPELPLGGATATPSPPQGVATAHSEGATAPSQGATATPFSSPPSAPQEEEASSPEPGARPDMKLFGNFWLIYPKSRDRPATLAAWRSALDAGAEPQQIITAAEAYAREKAGEEFRFIKYSANWLRERRYEDDYAPKAEPGAARPQLRAVSGGWQPWTNPEDQSVYTNGW